MATVSILYEIGMKSLDIWFRNHGAWRQQRLTTMVRGVVTRPQRGDVSA